MADNTRLKDLANDVKKILELMESRNVDYNMRFHTLETAIDDIVKNTTDASFSSTMKAPPFQVRNVKIDFPRFDAEQFFEYYNTPDDQHLTIAAIHLDKEVAPWYQMMARTNPWVSWTGFTRSLELEFGPSPYECPRSDLFKLMQTGSVQDYYVQFTALANRVHGVTSEALLDCFIGGLNLEICRDVVAQSPTTLMLKSTSLPALLPTPPKSTFTPSNVKKLSPAEVQLRRDHKCLNKQYLFLQIVEPEPPDPNSQLDLMTNLEHHLSFNALKGSSGSIHGMRIQVLLDSGSSDNFLQPRLASCLKLPIEPVPNFHVLVAYLLPVTGADLVLGAAWLATLASPAQFNHLRRMSHTKAQPIMGPQEERLEIPHDMDPALSRLLHLYKPVFAIPKGLPHLTGVGPVRVRPYRYPHSQKLQIEKMIQEMLQDGLIVRSNSPFSSPIVLVKKKDGTWRFCTDYRAVNAITVKDSFPIPTVDELIDELHGARFFSKLDLRSGYHQIRMKEEDRYKTAFQTHQGHYEWLVMPFGLSNAPATFQCLMNDVFRGLLRKFVLLLFHHQLYVCLSKCSFGLQNVDYLGHSVPGSGLSMDKDKVAVVMDWPVPINIKQLRGFLGLTKYYKRFIREYASIAAPLTNMLKKDNFQWTKEALTALDSLKIAMTQAPVLALPDFEKPFTLETNASSLGIKAVLSQDNHPIAFFSKKLTPTLQKKSAYTREFYAITEAIAKFDTICWDINFLRSLTDQAIQTPEQQAWLHKLLGYDFTIEYKPGKDNIAADSLSRSFHMAWSQPRFPIIARIKQALLHDTKLAKIMELYLTQKNNDPHYWVSDGLLYWKGRLVLPDDLDLQQQIVHECHNSLIGGHAGYTRTLAHVLAQFHWHGIHKFIKNYVQNCLVCQQAKTATTAPAGLLHPLPIPNLVWEDVAMDFITGLPPSHGYTVIMVVVDRLSKYAHFAGLRADYSSKVVADSFMTTVVKLHGTPKIIVSDQDKLVNKFLEMYLRCFTFDSPKEWYKLLPWAEYWYNTAYHTSIGMTPFRVVYGREPPQILKYTPTVQDSATVQDQLILRDATLAQLKANLQRAQQVMKKYADKKRIPKEFVVGDMVLVKLQPYFLWYFGPFSVVERIGAVAYKLLLPSSTKIHPVFHISQLKICHGNHTQPYVPLPLTVNEQFPIIQPMDILHTRWEGMDEFEATWEDKDAFKLHIHPSTLKTSGPAQNYMVFSVDKGYKFCWRKEKKGGRSGNET
ncbi:hypothetical protein V8G54_031486 [Vigna mungo]|uniref:Uncharacterized protein n=1 Tax=Vigna mungo TaxID=3915 RepID=A0AAQ3RGY4_VIGMU